MNTLRLNTNTEGIAVMNINRLEVMRLEVFRLIDAEQWGEKMYFLSHLYGVSDFCALIALQRGLDVEIAATSGMLHDIHQVTHGMSYAAMKRHAAKGSEEAAYVLRRVGLYSEEEISIVTAAISQHSDKANIHTPYDEVLKDADVMHHRLFPYDPAKESEAQRYERLLVSLGVKKH